MKQKLLLKSLVLLFALIAGSTSVWATELGISFDNLYQGGSKVTAKTVVTTSGGSLTFTDENELFSIKITRNSSNQPGFYTSSGYLRFYNTDEVEVTSLEGATITSIVITTNGTSEVAATVSPGSISSQTWSGSSSKVTFTGTGTNRWDAITITYTAASVSNPIFSPVAGAVEKGTSVSISTTTDGASIYYTTNGDTPTSSSTLYSGPLTINFAQTIKAIAIKGSDASSVVTAAYTIKKVETPTFSVAEGDVIAGTTVELETTTEGAVIHYTIDGSTPTASSATYSTPIEIDANMTIKAIAVKTNWDDSEVASATYTTLASIPGLTIDFEASNLAQYVDWEFVNIKSATTTISAHGGTYYGNTDGKATASIKTKAKIAHPGLFTCYISKESGNTSSSNWKIQVSSDGTSWTDVATKSATGMSKGEWQEFSKDLTAYTDVYVRLSYGSSTAIRAVDDITLAEAVSATINPTYEWATFSYTKPLDFTATEVKAYIVTGFEGSAVTKTQVNKVPANTGLLLNGTTDYIPLATGDLDDVSANKMVAVTTATTISKVDGKTRYVLADEGGKAMFLSINETAAYIPAGKAYLEIDGAGARELYFDDTTAIKALENATKIDNDAIYDLSGRRVENPTKGIYIINGKKVIFK